MQPGPEKDRLRRRHGVTANENFEWESVYRDNVERAQRLFVVAAAAALGLVVGAVVVVSLLASGALPWLLGTILAVAVSGVVVLGLHAGGHGWFVPIPVLVLAGAWALTVSEGSWTSATASALAALAFRARLWRSPSYCPLSLTGALPSPSAWGPKSSWAPAALPSALLPRGG